MTLTKPAPTRRRKSKDSYHHGDLEAALLVEAKRLVSKHGVEKLSLRQVGVNIGVSPSAAYHHFPDKDSLLTAAAKSAFEDLANFQEVQLAQFSANSALGARRRFRALGASYVAFAQSNSNLFRLCFGPYCGGEDMAREESRPWQLLASCVTDLEKFGEVDPKLRPYAELLAWTSIHGVATLVLDELLPEDAVESVLDALELSLKGTGKVAR